MNDSRKIVFSTTLEQATWKNTSIMTELSAGGIAQLKEETGKDIVIYGSGNMVGQLTQLGLIDDYHIFVNPVVLGRGKSMFKEVADQRQLVLAEARTFSNGVVLLHYLSGQSA
jgi:dihydrofolate reductase